MFIYICMLILQVTHLEKSSREMLKCDICAQTILGRASLQRHVRHVHEKKWNYPCSYCEKKWISNKDLKRHVESMHPADKEKIHPCDKCEYKSHSKFTLTRHVPHNHTAKRHECYFCKKRFARFEELAGHCSQVHCLEK